MFCAMFMLDCVLACERCAAAPICLNVGCVLHLKQCVSVACCPGQAVHCRRQCLQGMTAWISQMSMAPKPPQRTQLPW